MKLILVNLALLSTVTWQVARPPPQPPEPVAPAAVAVQPKVDTASAPQADAPRRDYAAVSERPIFFADRRVPEPDAVIEVVEEEVIEEEIIEETEPPRDISLLGTVITGDITLALVVPVGGDAQRVAVGDLIAGWTVDEIQPNLVRVSGSEGPRQLKIERGASGKDGRAVARNYGARQRTPAQPAGQSASVPGPRGVAGQRAQAGRSNGAANRGGNPANSGVAAGGGVISRAAAGSAAQANGNGTAGGDAAATTATGGNTTTDSAATGNATNNNNPFSNGATQTAGNVTPGTNVNGNVVAVPTVTAGTSGFNAEAVRVDANGNLITRSMADYMVGAEGNEAAGP